MPGVSFDGGSFRLALLVAKKNLGKNYTTPFDAAAIMHLNPSFLQVRLQTKRMPEALHRRG